MVAGKPVQIVHTGDEDVLHFLVLEFYHDQSVKPHRHHRASSAPVFGSQENVVHVCSIAHPPLTKTNWGIL
jgi:hypothetical protein